MLQVITEFKEFASNAQTVKSMNHLFKPADQNAKTAKFGSSTNANATPAATSLVTVVKFVQLEPNTMLPHKNVKRSANYPTNNSSTESADVLKALSQIKEESVLLKYVLMTVPTTPSPTPVSATLDTIYASHQLHAKKYQFAQPMVDSIMEFVSATLDSPLVLIKKPALNAKLTNTKSSTVKHASAKVATPETQQENASRLFSHQPAKTTKSMTQSERIASVFLAVIELKESVLLFLNAKLINTSTVKDAFVRVDLL